jgi:signal transduction histidine kinase
VEITLISDDRDLWRLCREVLLEGRYAFSALSAVKACTARPGADFYIWDFDTAESLPAWLNLNAAKSLFLVNREELSQFREASRGQAANILLKPVTSAMLAAFLDVVFAISPDYPADQKRDSAECLLQTSLRLQRHDHERSDFIAGIAHDLRTPAAALLGYSGLLLDEGQGHLDENQKTILRYMHSSADRLSRMVSAVFELSVERQRARGVNLEAGDFPGCLGQALHETALQAGDKRIAVQTWIEPVEGDLYFDRNLIERVLVNLLENACRFAPLNGSIEILGYPFFWERRSANVSMPTPIDSRSSSRNAPNSYRVDIRNSGAAIPPGQLDHIFEQYVASTPARQQSGCGLGLAICRTIIAGHQGRIWAENTETGPGFSFVLPGGCPQSCSSREPGAHLRLGDKPPNEVIPLSLGASVNSVTFSVGSVSSSVGSVNR